VLVIPHTHPSFRSTLHILTTSNQASLTRRRRAVISIVRHACIHDKQTLLSAPITRITSRAKSDLFTLRRSHVHAEKQQLSNACIHAHSRLLLIHVGCVDSTAPDDQKIIPAPAGITCDQSLKEGRFLEQLLIYVK